MNTESNAAVLDELFESVSRCLTPEVARRIVDLRAAPAVKARIDELANKNGEGTLTLDEQHTYETYVRAVNFIGVLQAKARSVLAADSPR